MLRRSFNKVEVTTRMNVVQLLGLDLLEPAKYQGQALLIDGFDYMLPMDRNVEVAMTLRTMRPIGDTATGQIVPDVGPSTQTWKWVFYRSNLDEQVERTHQRMIQTYGSADLLEVIGGDAWASDVELMDPPSGPGSVWRDYEATVVFGVYETDEDGRVLYVSLHVPVQYRVGLVAEYS